MYDETIDYCEKCGAAIEPENSSKTCCASCLNKIKERYRSLSQKRKFNNECVRCGNKLTNEDNGKITCKKCIDMIKSKKMEKQNTCVSSRHIIPNFENLSWDGCLRLATAVNNLAFKDLNGNPRIKPKIDIYIKESIFPDVLGLDREYLLDIAEKIVKKHI